MIIAQLKVLIECDTLITHVKTRHACLNIVTPSPVILFPVAPTISLCYSYPLPCSTKGMPGNLHMPNLNPPIFVHIVIRHIHLLQSLLSQEVFS
jgi:hypothetical protein